MLSKYVPGTAELMAGDSTFQLYAGTEDSVCRE